MVLTPFVAVIWDSWVGYGMCSCHRKFIRTDVLFSVSHSNDPSIFLELALAMANDSRHIHDFLGDVICKSPLSYTCVVAKTQSRTAALSKYWLEGHVITHTVLQGVFPSISHSADWGGPTGPFIAFSCPTLHHGEAALHRSHHKADFWLASVDDSK